MIELLHLDFMQNALLASVFGGATLAIAGVFVTLMDIPFLGISMSHSAFLGAIVGLLCGFDPLLGAIAFGVLSGLAVGPVSDRAGASSNVILAIIFSATMGLAFLLLARIPGPKTEALNLIWGSILTVSRREVWLLAAIFLATLVLLALFYKELAAVLFNREIAAAAGIPATTFYYGLIILCGLVVSASLDIVGGMLIFSLLVNPASAACQIAHRLHNVFVLAAVFGVLSCLAGLAVSYLFNVPTGAVIVLASTLIFLLAFLFSPKRRARAAITG
jgi:manganese/iron transport system permease protein